MGQESGSEMVKIGNWLVLVSLAHVVTRDGADLGCSHAR